MIAAADWTSELDALLDRLVDGEFTDADRLRLNTLLAQGEGQRRHYRHYMKVHNGLEWRIGRLDSRPVFALPVDAAMPPADGRDSPLPSIIIAQAPSPHPSLFSLNSPLGNFLFAYSASAVVLAVAVFLGWAIKMSTVAGTLRVPSHDGLEITSDNGTLPVPATLVGRISGLADCKWSDPGTKTAERSVIRVGRTYALDSGFLELTYHSGAKVILQGPCVYRVTSPRSGYLEIGKLTANVGARGEGRGTREVASGQWSVPSESRASNPQSLIPNPPLPSPLAPRPSPLFVVTTPTAVVTDLGTEFGVEVEKSGTTRSHVFKGRVQVRSSNSNSRGPMARGDAAAQSGSADVDQVVELTANQSASVIANGDGKATLTRNAGAPSGIFVRKMPRSAFRGIPPVASIGDRPGDLAGLGEKVAYACAIDAAGQLVEYSTTIAGAAHVFFCSRNGAWDIGTFGPGGVSLTSDDIAKRVAVASNVATRGFFHVPGKGMKDIGTLGGPASRAVRIGPANQLVGYSANASGAPHAFLYSDGKMQDLGTLGGARSFATDINAAGQVVGASQTSDGTVHAFLYTPGAGMKDLGSLGGPKATSWVCGIDDAGRVSGCSEVKGGRTHAFYYTDRDGMVDLGDIGDGEHVICYHNGRMNISRLEKGSSDGSLRIEAKPDSPPLDTTEKKKPSS